MVDDFRFLMLSAMYENGGNTTHRLIDGHPQMFVYPFESQLGTRYVNDFLTSMYPLKYRWPVFLQENNAIQDYESIIDEEMKVRAKTPYVSKFRDKVMDFSDQERFDRYKRYITHMGRSRPTNIIAYFKATFEAWKDYVRTNEQVMYVGYSPVIIVDAEKIINDLPQAHILHIVRNPWSAYADTKKRAVPLSIEHYLAAWTQNQYYAQLYQNKYPDRIHILRLEDILGNPLSILGEFCKKLGLDASSLLTTPTWNKQPLKEIYPWGTIRYATSEANKVTAEELSKQEREEIYRYAQQYINFFDYKNFIQL